MDAGLPMDGLLALDLWDLVIGSRTFVPNSWVCQKQYVSVSQLYRSRDHIIGNRFACEPKSLPLDLWDLVIEVLGTIQRIPKPTQACTGNGC